ncbi:MAG: ATP-dependent Clp protease adaptor ClpS, partial [Pseudomonadota bacterium]
MAQDDNDDTTTTIPRLKTKVKPKVEKPKLYKVLLLNDDFTPREFVVQILKAEFRLTEDEAYQVMITAHQKGLCVVAQQNLVKLGFFNLRLHLGFQARDG